jgi:hypothetical protein
VRPTATANSALALTLALGGGNSRFDFDGFPEDSHTTLKQSLVDLGLIFGHRVHPEWLVFGGPFASGNRYHGHYFSARGNNPDIEQDFEGRLNVLGANAGLAYTPRNWLSVAAEVAGGRVTAGRTRETPVTGTLLVQFWFGPRRHGMPGDPDQPIRVVPVDETE